MPFSFEEQIENDTNCPQKSKFICLYFRSKMTKLINCQHGSIWQERVQNSSPTTTTPWTQISVHQTLVMIGTFVSQHLYNAKIFKVSSITNHKLITYRISISLLFIPNDWKRSTLQTIHIWRLMKSISHIMHPCFHESMNKYIQNTWDVYTWILYPHHISVLFSMDLIKSGLFFRETSEFFTVLLQWRKRL